MSHLNASISASFGIRAFGSQMAQREDEYLCARRFAARGNDRSMFDSRAHGRDWNSTSRVAARGSSRIYPDPRDLKFKRLRQRVRDLELQHEIQRLKQQIQDLKTSSTWKETEPEEPVRDELTGDEEHPTHGDFFYHSPSRFDNYEDEEVNTSVGDYRYDSAPMFDTYGNDEEYTVFIGGDMGVDGAYTVPTVATGCVSMVNDGHAKMSDVVKVATHLNFKCEKVVDHVDKYFLPQTDKGDSEVCMPVMMMLSEGLRREEEINSHVMINESTDVACNQIPNIISIFNAGGGSVARNNCKSIIVKLKVNRRQSNAPFDTGGTCAEPGETTSEVKLFRWVVMIILNESRVDVPFDSG